MFQRLSRLNRAFVVIAAVAVLGVQQASAAWICLPPLFSAVAWVATIANFAQNQLISQSRAGLSDSGDSERPTPLCLTDPVSLSVWAEPVNSEIQLSQTVTVKIYGEFSEPVISFGFHLDYDRTLLTLTGLTPASTFTALNSPHTDGVAGLAYPDSLEGDRVLLATARFKANAVGTSEIDIAVTPNDPTEGFELASACDSEATLAPASVTIIDRPIPEPSSLLLLLAGVGVLGRRTAFGRRT